MVIAGGYMITHGQEAAMVHGLLLRNYTPKNLTWHPKMEILKMIFLFNGVILRFQPLVFGGVYNFS